jgi:hypothetical protein
MRNAIRAFLPRASACSLIISISGIDSQLKQINDLLTSNYEGDIDKGFDLIDTLQTRLGVDLKKYSKEIGDAVQKLYDMNKQRKEDKAEVRRLQVERTEELTRERDILRERGINTYVNIREGKLELKSKKEERLELKRIKKPPTPKGEIQGK